MQHNANAIYTIITMIIIITMLHKTKLLNVRGSTCTYLFAVLPVTDDIKSLKVKNIPLSPTNLVAASVLGYW